MTSQGSFVGNEVYFYQEDQNAPFSLLFVVVFLFSIIFA